MITKKQYAWASHASAILYQGGRDADVTSQDLIELIESLRRVARAADGLIDTLDSDGGNAYLPDNIDLGLLRRALDAVSQWVLEASDG